MPRRKAMNPKPKVEPQPQIHGSFSELDTVTMLQGYYSVVFALLRGSHERTRLPLELVVYICKLVCFSRPNPSKAFPVQRISPGLTSRPCCGPFPGPKILLRTPPLAALNSGSPDIARFEVVVSSLRGKEYRVSTRMA